MGQTLQGKFDQFWPTAFLCSFNKLRYVRLVHDCASLVDMAKERDGGFNLVGLLAALYALEKS